MDRIIERVWEGTVLTFFVVGLILGIVWASVFAVVILLFSHSMWVAGFGGSFASLVGGSAQLLTAVGIVLIIRHAKRIRSMLGRLFFGGRTLLP